jgi:TolB-like protein/Flp pilus assembly protein TadD
MSKHMVDLRDRSVETPSADRLDSWKEIAAYLKYSEKTVRRWQEEGLPVHRHPHRKRAAVYAYKPEIDAWWNDGHARLAELARTQAEQSRTRPRWLAVGGVALLLLVTGSYLERTRFWPRTKPPAGRIMFAVLPFQNLTGDPNQDYFIDGLTEELITDLGRMNPGRLGVIARTSVMLYKNSREDIQQFARALGVDYVLEGAVRRQGERVRITAQLIQVRDQTHLWAQSYDRELHNMLAVQDDVARNVADEIRVELTPQQRARLSATRQADPNAQDAYLRGLYELREAGGDRIDQAIGYFEQAVARDPSYALAYASLSDAYYAKSGNRAPLEVMPQAKAAAQKAIQLDDTMAEAHASLGYVKLFFDWDWPGAESEFRRALDLNSNLPKAHMGYAAYLSTLGRGDEAVREAEHAYALDPIAPIPRTDKQEYFILARRYEEGLEQCRKEIELYSNSPPPYVWMAVALVELGRMGEATAAADRATELNAGHPLPQAIFAYAAAGQKQKARNLLPVLQDPLGNSYICGYNMAIIHLALGEKDEAIRWLEKAYRDRSD